MYVCMLYSLRSLLLCFCADLLQHFRNNAAILLKPGPLQEKMKTYIILALSDAETKSRKLSKLPCPLFVQLLASYLCFFCARYRRPACASCLAFRPRVASYR